VSYLRMEPRDKIGIVIFEKTVFFFVGRRSIPFPELTNILPEKTRERMSAR